MIEDRETIITPVKIEYNLTNDIREFNVIDAVDTLFKRMAQTDPTIKVYGHQNKMLLWEENDKLSENEDFVE